ncbi:MAG: hypothetical protein ACTSO9_04405 [Candidatus Helarchaeota archaeon]
MATWGKAFSASALYGLFVFLWSLVGVIIIAVPIVTGIYVPELRQGLAYIILIITCAIAGIFLISLASWACHFKLFGEVLSESEVSWGRGWRAAAAYVAWSFLWSLLGCIIIGAGFFIVIYENITDLMTQLIILLPLGFGGFFLICFGTYAAYIKIFAEVINDSEVTWGRGFRASLAIFFWSLLWILVGCGLIILGFYIPYAIYGSLIFPESLYYLVPLGLCGIFILLLCNTAVWYKIFPEVVTDDSYGWGRAYRGAIAYVGWAILWILIGGIIIFLGYTISLSVQESINNSNMLIYLLMAYEPNLMLFLQPHSSYMPLIIQLSTSIAGFFLIIFGCNAAYYKILGDIIVEK